MDIAVIITLVVFATSVVTIIAAHRIANRNNKLHAEVKFLKKQLRLHDAANKDTKAIYDVRRIDDKGEERVFYGNWVVCRISFQELMIVTTVIKVFTDADDDFNHREATELCDKLNEK